jgi:hypothetical protein
MLVCIYCACPHYSKCLTTDNFVLPEHWHVSRNLVSVTFPKTRCNSVDILWPSTRPDNKSYRNSGQCASLMVKYVSLFLISRWSNDAHYTSTPEKLPETVPASPMSLTLCPSIIGSHRYQQQWYLTRRDRESCRSAGTVCSVDSHRHPFTMGQMVKKQKN